MAKLLGVRLWSPPDLDTDQFGTFSGDVARPGTPVEMLHAKIALCRSVLPNPIMVASEGSYAQHPLFRCVALAHEWMIWDDAANGFQLIEHKAAITPHYYAAMLENVAELELLLQRCGWPKLAVTVHPADLNLPSYKGLQTGADIQAAIETLQAAGAKKIQIATDMRANLHPYRQRTIRHLAAKLARRVRTACPQCHQFGFGQRHTESGLECADCRTPSNQLKAICRRCEFCDYRKYTWRAAGQADPFYCPYCNP
ncbi:DUF6671 family protein [Iodobacter sp. LRB]|uniref:DUF6671 family protein n=1 Tax=unclassified Iodobacter TaxID=235634 RepID=UPI000C0E92C0|nr:DUF6671 family protein [Iodobacter sp. BJB302]PHV00817.1 hypothetical protein CSQ88_15420 [Iodobacter sp. BJB302]